MKRAAQAARAAPAERARPLLVAHLTTVHARGDTRIFLKQAQTLQAAFPGHEVALVVADGRGDAGEAGPRSVSVHDLGAPRGRFGRLVHGSVRAFRRLRRLRPLAVHFHDPELIPLGLLLKLFRFRVIYDVHEDMPRQMLGKFWLPPLLRYPAALAIGAMEWAAGRAFDGIVPATPTIAARFPAGKSVLVRNYPVKAELVSGERTEYLSRPPAFVYVGGIAWIRGAREMIAAADALRDREGFSLHVAGTFERAGLADEVARLPGWDRVRFHGFVGRREVADLLGRARAGLVVLHPLPNYRDALPIKLFEYMAAGLPVIASDFPLWRQIIEDADCGLLVDPLDPGALASAMRWMLDNPEAARAMGERGRRAVEERYNWEREGETLVSFYRRLQSVQ